MAAMKVLVATDEGSSQINLHNETKLCHDPTFILGDHVSVKWDEEESSPARVIFVFRNGEDDLMALVHASKAFCNKSAKNCNSVLCSHC